MAQITPTYWLIFGISFALLVSGLKGGGKW
jgi:hypothetical protein